MSSQNNVQVQTETFNQAALGQYSQYSSVLGSFTGRFQVQGSDQFGGANNSDYMAFGAQSGSESNVTLALNNAANYFGFWWSAADANNEVRLFSNGSRVGTVSDAQLSSMLSGSSVQALNGQTYQSSDYYCNPNNMRQDCGEAFAYINVFASGTTIDKIVFSNGGSTGTGFEGDNYSVATGLVSPGYTSSQAAATPEPGTIATMLASLAAIGFGVVKQRRPKE